MQLRIRQIIIFVAVLAVLTAILERRIHQTVRLTVENVSAGYEHEFWFTLNSTDAHYSGHSAGSVFVSEFGNSKLFGKYIDSNNFADISGTTFKVRYCNWSILGFQQETWKDRFLRDFPDVRFIIPGSPPGL